MNKLLRTFGIFLVAAGGCVANAAKPSNALMLLATRDFPVLQVKGFAQTRVEADKGVISVDADITGYAFGMAETKFAGADGTYDVTLTTMQDGDGVCDYFLRIGGVETPRFRQKGTENGAPEEHTWKGVVIRNGDMIGVAGNGGDSKQKAPGKGPKGFHMAHGRWSKLTLVRTAAAPSR